MLAGFLGSSFLPWGRQPRLALGNAVGIKSTTISADDTFGVGTATVSLVNSGTNTVNLTALASCELVGVFKVFKNSGPTNTITLRSSAPSTIVALAPGDWAAIWHDGTSWKYTGSVTAGILAYILATANAWSALQTFGAGAALKDSASYFYDDGDATKRAALQCSGITTGTTRTLTVPDASGTIALTSSNISGSAGSVASTGYFLSAQQTGNGLAQNIPHGLGVTPNLVFAIPDDIGGGGVFAVSYGTHTSTNAVVTFSNGQKYRVVAFK